jgi:hypothetical protein
VILDSEVNWRGIENSNRLESNGHCKAFGANRCSHIPGWLGAHISGSFDAERIKPEGPSLERFHWRCIGAIRLVIYPGPEDRWACRATRARMAAPHVPWHIAATDARAGIRHVWLRFHPGIKMGGVPGRSIRRATGRAHGGRAGIGDPQRTH